MKGRKPLPTQLKIVRGTDEKRHINPDEPTPEMSDLAPPAELSPAALKEWERVRSLLVDAGVVSVLDTTALIAYCETYATWADAMSRLRRTGMILKNEKGVLYRNPLIRVANDAQDRMVKLLAEFGMTPSSRTRVSAIKPVKTNDKWAAFRR